MLIWLHSLDAPDAQRIRQICEEGHGRFLRKLNEHETWRPHGFSEDELEDFARSAMKLWEMAASRGHGRPCAAGYDLVERLENVVRRPIDESKVTWLLDLSIEFALRAVASEHRRIKVPINREAFVVEHDDLCRALLSRKTNFSRIPTREPGTRSSYVVLTPLEVRAALARLSGDAPDPEALADAVRARGTYVPQGQGEATRRARDAGEYVEALHAFAAKAAGGTLALVARRSSEDTSYE
jgi:hypothetical protein